MKPAIWANMPVKNVKKTYKFYLALGMKPLSKLQEGDRLTCFRFTDDDFVINFFKKSELRKSMGSKTVNAKKENEIIFTLGVDSEKEVENWVKKVKAAKGKIFLKPTRIKEGYNMVFADPDGHRFNVFCMKKKEAGK